MAASDEFGCLLEDKDDLHSRRLSGALSVAHEAFIAIDGWALRGNMEVLPWVHRGPSCPCEQDVAAGGDAKAWSETPHLFAAARRRALASYDTDAVGLFAALANAQEEYAAALRELGSRFVRERAELEEDDGYLASWANALRAGPTFARSAQYMTTNQGLPRV